MIPSVPDQPSAQTGSANPDWRSELRRTWAMHDPNQQADGGLYAFEIGRSVKGDPIRVFVGDDLSHHLLLPAPLTTAIEAPGDAISCTMVQLVFDGRTGRYLDLACGRPELLDIFDDLLASVLDEVTRSADPVLGTTEVLRRWRELLRARRTPLGLREEMALFAELWTLRATSGPIHVDTWRGPLREPKDVVGPGYWIEVKAVAPSTDRVSIHGLEQLEPIDGLMGRLVVVEMTEDSSGESVESVLADVRSRADDVDLLAERLLLAGWTGDDDRDRRWSANRVLSIDPAMAPALTRGSLVGAVPAGISRIRYDIDLGVLRVHAGRSPERDIAMITSRGST